MRLGNSFYVIGGIATIGSMAIYAIFRIGSIAPIVLSAGTSLDIVVMLFFFVAEMFIVIKTLPSVTARMATVNAIQGSRFLNFDSRSIGSVVFLGIKKL